MTTYDAGTTPPNAPPARWPDAVLAGAAILAWLAFIVYRIADFSSADAQNEMQTNLPFLLDVFTRVPRNLGELGPVLLFIASAFGIGDLLVAGLLRLRPRSRTGRAAFALCVGLACWTIFILVVGSFGWLNRPVLGTAMGAALLFTVVRLVLTRAQWRPAEPAQAGGNVLLRIVAISIGLLIALHLYFALLGALAPEVQFDARFYHLTEAKRYADHGALFNLAASQGSVELALPQNQETLYAGMYSLFGEHAVKILSWSNLPLTLLAIFGFASEFFRSRRMGLLAALLFASTPIVAWSASTASNDLSLAPYTLLGLYAVIRWSQERDAPGWLLLAGFLCGFAFGIKPFALFDAVALAAIVAFNAKRGVLPALALLAGGLALGAIPGMAREFAITGDPLYPIAAHVTHSPFWAPALDSANRDSIHAFGADTSWPVLLKLPWVLTLDVAHYRNVVGPFMLFALPFVVALAFLPKGNRIYKQMFFFLAAWTFMWFATGLVEARYAEAVFGVLTLLAAYLALTPQGGLFGHRLTQGVFAAVLVAIGIFNLQPLVPYQRSATLGYVSGYVPFIWPYLYGKESEDDVQLVYAPAVQYINQHLDAKTDKVFFATEDLYFDLYSNIDIYDDVTPLARLIHPWTLYSPNAYQHLKDVGADYIVVYKDSEREVKASPLYRHLVEVANVAPGLMSGGEAGSREILYRVL